MRRIIKWSGYNFLKFPSHHRANKQGYVKIADLVLEEKICRRLKKNEISHHINGKKTDDRPKNLEEKIRKKHRKFHTTLRHKSEKFGFQSKEKHIKWVILPKKKIIQMFLNGNSLRKIGRHFGVDHKTIAHRLEIWKYK